MPNINARKNDTNPSTCIPPKPRWLLKEGFTWRLNAEGKWEAMPVRQARALDQERRSERKRHEVLLVETETKAWKRIARRFLKPYGMCLGGCSGGEAFEQARRDDPYLALLLLPGLYSGDEDGEEQMRAMKRKILEQIAAYDDDDLSVS